MNAVGVVQELRQDIVATATGGSTLAAAARALHSDSDLYALLLSYTDLGGCSSMVAAVAAPARIESTLASPCPRLERAATLFTQATANDDAAALLEAARVAHLAEPQLVQLLLDLHAR